MRVSRAVVSQCLRVRISCTLDLHIGDRLATNNSTPLAPEHRESPAHTLTRKTHAGGDKTEVRAASERAQ